MTKNIKKIKAFAGSLTAFVLSIGIGQEVCALNCNQDSAKTMLSRAFDTAYLNTKNIRINGDDLGDKKDTVLSFKNRRSQPIFYSDPTAPIGNMDKHHEFSRHFLATNKNTPQNTNADITDFFLLPGNKDNVCAILNLLDPEGANNFRFSVYNYGDDATVYADIDIPRIGASLIVDNEYIPGQAGCFCPQFSRTPQNIKAFNNQDWKYLDKVDPIIKGTAIEYPTVNELKAKWQLSDDGHFSEDKYIPQANEINYIPMGWPSQTLPADCRYKEVCIPFFIDHAQIFAGETSPQKAGSNFAAVTARFALTQTPEGTLFTPSSFWPICSGKELAKIKASRDAESEKARLAQVQLKESDFPSF